jgi:hypothetical protein
MEWKYSCTILDLSNGQMLVSPPYNSCFVTGKIIPSTQGMEGWVGPKAGMHNVEKLKIPVLARNQTPATEPIE